MKISNKETRSDKLSHSLSTNNLSHSSHNTPQTIRSQHSQPSQPTQLSQQSQQTLTLQLQSQTSLREFNHKNEKKLKPEKVYRFQCGGYLDTLGGTGIGVGGVGGGINGEKGCKRVEYKAEYDRPVEEFIYPSLQLEDKDKDTVKSIDSNNLRWKFKEEEIKATEVPSRNLLISRVEKGEKYLRESLKTKYHGRVLTELKDKEDKQYEKKPLPTLAELAGSVTYPRRDNIVKTLGIYQKKPAEDIVNADDLVSTDCLFSLLFLVNIGYIL